MNKNDPFEHEVVERLDESVNQMDYTSPMKNPRVSWENSLGVIKLTELVTPFTRNSEVTVKRNFSDAMKTEGGEISEIDKKQKIDAEGELVEFVKTESKKNHVKIKGPTSEVQQYDFSEFLETLTDNFKSRACLM